MRLVVLEGTDAPNRELGREAIDVAIWLAHAPADELGKVEVEAKGDELLPGISERLAMDLIQNYAFHGQEDITSGAEARSAQALGRAGSRCRLRRGPRAAPTSGWPGPDGVLASCHLLRRYPLRERPQIEWPVSRTKARPSPKGKE
jgi:hypothetical protein